MSRQQLNIRLKDGELQNWLDRAERSGISLSEFVRFAVEAFNPLTLDLPLPIPQKVATTHTGHTYEETVEIKPAKKPKKTPKEPISDSRGNCLACNRLHCHPRCPNHGNR